MERRRGRYVGLAWLIAAVVVVWPAWGSARADLPDHLSNADFWALSARLSEPDGYFRSDNLLSNELYYPAILPELKRRVPQGGVYLGVGPEQNFHYIVAVRPRMVFLADIRRGNLHVHLLYKALFELSANRIEFVSRLFSKPRPASLEDEVPAAAIMDAFWTIDTSRREVFDRNLSAVLEHLTRTRSLPLSDVDRAGIADVYAAFYWFGPSITYSSTSSAGFGRRFMASYYDLMVAADERGAAQSFLASEETFAFVKSLHARNLIVPLVGDFGGPRALRAVGEYLRGRDATVSAFYLSNVEQYLRQQGAHGRFCANVASLPLDARSTFIRSESGGGDFRNLLGVMLDETSACLAPAATGDVRP